MVEAPQTVAAQLGAEPLARVIRRRQATIRDGATAALLTSWFPAVLAEAVPELLDRTRVTGEIDGYRPARGEDWVSARPPSSAEVREFGIKRGSPVTVVHNRRFGADETVLEYAELIARADTRVFTATATAKRNGNPSWEASSRPASPEPAAPGRLERSAPPSLVLSWPVASSRALVEPVQRL